MVFFALFLRSQAAAVQGRLRPENERKIAMALGMFENNVDIAALEEKVRVTPSTTLSPLMFEDSLFKRARQERKHIVLPEGDDDRILQKEILEIQAADSRVRLLVIPTDEEYEIASQTLQVLNKL